MKVLFLDSVFWTDSNLEFKRACKRVISDAYTEARKRLPWVTEYLSFLVQPTDHGVIAETGEGATTHSAELITLRFDPALPHGNQALLQYIRESVFHELNHAARFQLRIWSDDLLGHCIFEGLGTVFERDRAGSKPSWGDYDAELCRQWTTEIKSLKDSSHWNDYMFKHPDGRRWIGYKVGTYLVDQAIQKSGKSIEALTQLMPAEIIQLAEQ